MKEKKRLLIKLFLSTFYLSAFTFGGGYVIVTLMKRKFVDDYHWLSEEEMLDFTAIAQSAPGPIAINGAIVVGYRLAGIPGVLTAITATVIPPFITISLISVFYQVFRTNFIVSQMLEGMQAGIGAVIASVTWDMASGIFEKQEWDSILILFAAWTANYCFGVNVVVIILICMILGIGKALLMKRRNEP